MMQRILKLMPLAVLCLASCSNQAEKTNTENTEAPAPQQEVVAANANEIKDPVCGMVKDSTWTDYTVYKGDTVWFCASQEKEAFLANPQKYEKNLPQQAK